MASRELYSWRGDYQEDCKTPQGKLETYAGFEHGASDCPRGGFGARLLDPTTGTERLYTEWHDDRSTAAKWLKIALGLCLVVGAALVAIGSVL
jgi:hypothetical protein